MTMSATAVATGAATSRLGVPLALLCALGLVTDLAGPMVVPTLPFIAETFGKSMAEAQVLTTAYLLATALSQPIHGPLSDRFGRRRMLLISLATVILMSLLSATAVSLEMLIACRVLEAIGASAALINTRAIAYDISESEPAAARRISYIVLTLGAGGIVAPTAAGFLIGQMSWRLPFLVAGIIAILIMIPTALYLPETSRGARQSRGLRGVLSDFSALFRNRTFVGFTLVLAASMGGTTAIIASIPMMGRTLFGFGPEQIGLSVSAAVVSGTLAFWLSGQIVLRTGLARLILVSLLGLVALTVVGAAVLDGAGAGLVLAAGIAAFVLFSLINVPAITGTLRVDGSLTATAAGVSTACSMLCASAASQLTAGFYRGSPLSTIGIAGAFTVMGLLGLALTRHRATA